MKAASASQKNTPAAERANSVTSHGNTPTACGKPAEVTCA